MIVIRGPRGTLGIKPIIPNTLAHTGISFQWLTKRYNAMNHRTIPTNNIKKTICRKAETAFAASGLTVGDELAESVNNPENVGTGVLSDTGATTKSS